MGTRWRNKLFKFGDCIVLLLSCCMLIPKAFLFTSASRLLEGSCGTIRWILHKVKLARFQYGTRSEFLQDQILGQEVSIGCVKAEDLRCKI